jgi:hypothetical protein
METGRQRARERLRSRQPLERHAEGITVLEEDPESGYGTALRDVDNGVGIYNFDDQDEIYQEIWIPGHVLEATANELSVRACEHGGDAE